MVKTRSQKIQKVFKIKRGTLTNREKREFGIRDLTIRLHQINLTEYSKLMQGSNENSKSHEQPKIGTAHSSIQMSTSSIRRQPTRIAKSTKTATPNVTQDDKTTTRRANRTADKHSIMPKKNNKKISIEIGELVMARQKYSVPWPSRIVAVRKRNVDVYFYGDGRVGAVKKEDLSTIGESKAVIVSCLKRNIHNYRKGIIEIERISLIPDHLSILNYS